MTAYETRCEREDEEDRLARRWYSHRQLSAMREAWYAELDRRILRPFDKQGDVEPFDIEQDWIERS